MKIAQVCPRYYPYKGGVEIHTKNISERLVMKGLEVEVLTTDPSSKLPKEEVINEVKIKRFRSWAPNEAYYFSTELNKYLMRKSSMYDIVHAHGYHAFPALYAAYTKNSNRFVFTSHYFATGATLFRTMLHIPYKFVARKIIQKADAIICVSNYEKTLLMQNFKVKSGNVSVIPNGVNLNDLKGLQRKQSNKRTLLYVGRLEEGKGVHYLIESLPSLAKDIKLDIIGSGPYYKNLLELAIRLRVNDRVNFYGGSLSRREIMLKYVNADLYVFLSKYECFAISVAEALAAGTACIVANSSALIEWIDNKNCFGIDYPINIDKLVALINQTIGKRSKGVRLFNWDDITEELIKIYVKVTNDENSNAV